MKIARARYTGTMRSHTRNCPSGESYKFRNPMGGEPRWEDIGSVADALDLEEQNVFDVEWTTQGEVARMVGSQVETAKDALEELSYRQKQKLTTALDLDVKGNSPEEELEEALEPAVQGMVKQLETQNYR